MRDPSNLREQDFIRRLFNPATSDGREAQRSARNSATSPATDAAKRSTSASKAPAGFRTTVGGVTNFTPALAIGRQFLREVTEFNAAVTLEFANGLQLSADARNLTNDEDLVAIFDGVA